MAEYIFGSVKSYPLFLVLAIALGAVVAASSATRSGLPALRFLRIHPILLLAGLAGAKVYSTIERGGMVGPFGWELTHGYRYPGGILGVFIATILVARVGRGSSSSFSIPALADILAPAVAFAMTLVRVGCFLAGCCTGSVCGLPWCLSFPPSSDAWKALVNDGAIPASAPMSFPVHPLPLYFGLHSLAVGMFLLWFRPRKAYAGQVALLYVALHEIGKGLLELFRYPPAPHLQLMSLGIGACGVVALAACAAYRKRTAHGRPFARSVKPSRSEEDGVHAPGLENET